MTQPYGYGNNMGDQQPQAQEDEFGYLPYIISRDFPKGPNMRYKFKICLIGDGGTGKTTFINRVLNGDFISKYYATQGAVTKNVKLGIGDNSFICYEVWDTAGQEKNAGLKDCYYIDAVSAFFFFDVNSKDSLANIPKHITAFLSSTTAANPKVFILANKIDATVKSLEFINKFRSRIPKCDYEIIKISAKTGYMFEEPFKRLSRYLFNNPDLQLHANIDLTPLNYNYDILAGSADTSVAVEGIENFSPEQ